MWVDERAIFWCGARRYLLAHAVPRSPADEWREVDFAGHVISDVLAQGGGWQVRDAIRVAAPTRYSEMLDDHQLLGVILCEFQAGCLRLFEFAERSGPPENATPTKRPTPAQEIVLSIAVISRRQLIYRGQRLTVMLQAELDLRAESGNHELVAPKEAQAILQAIAKDPRTPILRRTLFADASKVALPSTPPDPRNQLILLRERKVFIQERELLPAITPSQLKQAMSRGSRAAVDDKSWIEVEIVFADGSPANGYSYRFSLDGQPPKTGQVSDGHEMGYYKVDEGDASLRVWKPRPHHR